MTVNPAASTAAFLSDDDPLLDRQYPRIVPDVFRGEQ
jgi:hypothetical protein